MPDVTMPRLSDTMQEGTIAKWLKKPGDAVKRGDVLAQIETDKATMDLEAYDAGTLQEIVQPEGATVAIGQPIARIGSGSGAGAPAKDGAEGAGKSVEAGPVGRATGAEEPRAPEARAQADERPEPSGAASTREAGATPAGREAEAPERRPERDEGPPTNGKVRASPLARRIAEEHGLDLSSIQGSGPEGRVIRADVEATVAGGRKPAEAAPAPTAAPRPAAAPVEAGPDDERVPLSQMRKVIARRMAESTSTVPHFFLTVGLDATDLVALRKQVVQQMEAAGEGPKVSLNDFVVKAAATALRRVPEVNVSYAGDVLIKHSRVHVGIAVSLENGLIVPVVRDADRKSLSEIARETQDLSELARAGKLQPAEYTGGTFSISNLGMFGVEQFNAVINPPEAAILAVGAIQREPAEYDGQVALRERLRLTLSVDHRAVDGATGARYLQALKKLLEQPLLLLV